MTERNWLKIVMSAKLYLAALLLVVAVLAVGAASTAHAATITVDSTSNDVADDGVCTLREAITAANTDTASGVTAGECLAGTGPDTIELGAGLAYMLDVVDNNTEGNNGLPSITSEMTINGNGSTIQRDILAPEFRIFHVGSVGNLTLNEVTVSRGAASGVEPGGDGGGIFNSGTVDILASIVSDNSASRIGGGIFNGGDLTLTTSSISDNSSANTGGGIYNFDGTVTIFNSGLNNNVALGGGGIYNQGLMTVTDSTVTFNDAGSAAGGIYNGARHQLTLINSSVSNNTAGQNGGGITNNGLLIITESTISNNFAAHLGGGILNSTGDSLILTNTIINGNTAERGGGFANAGDVAGVTTVTNSKITGNTADLEGGGFFNDGGGVVDLLNSQVNGNSAGSLGGGIRNVSGAITLTNSTVNENIANDGGGIWSDDSLTLEHSDLNDNLATGVAADGGGIVNQGGVLALTDSTLRGNIADFDGGGLINTSQGEATITNSTFIGNSAISGDGGGIYQTGSTVTIENSTLSGNTAGGDGGAVYNLNGSVLITNGTLSANNAGNNGGGIRNTDGSTVTITNTLVANNLSGDDCFGSIASLGHNLDSDDTCNLSDPTDVPGMDPLMGPLQNNGGPTQTYALLDGSPAIDAGDDIACPDADQRGVTRPRGTACDIGAYEFVPVCMLTIDAHYVDGTLESDVTFSTQVPAAINLWVTSQSNILSLVSADIPVTDPPITRSISRSVPPRGTIGLLATMTTPEDGIICSAFETVDTG